MRYWYQGQPQRSNLDPSHDTGTMRYWVGGQPNGWLPGVSIINLALAGKGTALSLGKTAFSIMVLPLAGKARAGSRGKGNATGNIPLYTRGLAAAFGKAKPQGQIALKAVGMAIATGRAKGTFYFQLVGKGKSMSFAKAIAPTLIFPLKALGRAATTGKMKFRGFGARVITFTSYWSRRNP